MTIKTSDNSAGCIEHEQTVSVVFKLLCHHHRRVAIQYLATQAGTISVTDVADQIALLEGESTRDSHERICLSLVHCHLPILADSDIIRYDPDRQEVELEDQATDLLPYLDIATAD